MQETFGDRLKHAWNVFMNRDPTPPHTMMLSGNSRRPDRHRFSRGNERSIVTSVYTQMGTDVASLDFRHVQLDKEGRYLSDLPTKLNNCLSVEANLDQTHRAFFRDIIESVCDEGVIAVVPTDTTLNPAVSDSYDIATMRTGKILKWYPEEVDVQVYNEKTGEKVDVRLKKSMVAILENPFYAVMNESSSTLQRLIRKLNLLDAIDEQSGAGKLDLIIQLPYVVKSPTRRQQAEERRKEIEEQLAGSKYGIAYADGTERITQLNRPVENNLMKQIEYLTSMLYSQLGITQAVMDGTADEQTMLNYYHRTIGPFADMIVDEFKRKFITKTSRTQGKTIMYFRDPFKLVPVEKVADIGDKFVGNEILSPNEVRQIIGRKPSSDPKADQLINRKIRQPEENMDAMSEAPEITDEGGELAQW